MKKIIIPLIVIVVLALAGFGVYKIATAPKIPETNVAATDGLHWHAHLSISIKGENVPIPANIGVNGVMGAGGDPMELHTHETDGIIHAEFAGVVTKDQLEIGNFFKTWGKDFSKDSILGNMTGAGGTVKMTVNGEPNYEFEKYSITGKGTYDAGADGMVDDIRIVYE